MRCRPASIALISFIACGPTVSGGDADGTGTSESSTTSNDASTSASPTDPDGSSDAPLGGCGDGVLDPGEGCDDGNMDNADGCSAECLPSGTSVWSVPLEGFGVGLDVRDGLSVAGTQIFDGAFEPTVIVTGIARDGTTVGSLIDVGGLSDLDLARQPIAIGPDGTVALGYAVVSPRDGSPSRYVARADLSAGTQWEFISEERWSTYYGTAWTKDGIVVMHDELDESGEVRLVDWFSEDGVRLDRLSIPTEVTPLSRGAISARPITSVGVLTLSDRAIIEFHWTALPSESWGVDPVGMNPPASSRPRAFSDGLRLRIWTELERIEIDELDHVVSTTPHVVVGEVLWADAWGFVVRDGQALHVYGADDQLRWSVELPLTPSFVRGDVDLGLVVLSDSGVSPGLRDAEASLDYFVR